MSWLKDNIKKIIPEIIVGLFLLQSGIRLWISLILFTTLSFWLFTYKRRYYRWIIPSFLVSFFLLLSYFELFYHHPCDVLVLGISGDKNDEFQRHLISSLNEHTSLNDIIIYGSSKSFLGFPTSIDEAKYQNFIKKARRIGEKHNATLVLWGSVFGDRSFHPRVAIVPQETETIIEEEFTFSTIDIGRYDLPPGFINQTTDIYLIIIGILLKNDGEYLKAKESFDRVQENLYQNEYHALLTTIATNDLHVALIFRGPEYFHKAIEINTYVINSYDEEYDTPETLYSAYHNRGLSLAFIGEKENAILDLSHAISLFPERAIAYGNRGTLLNLSGEYIQAIADYNKAIEIDPEDFTAYDGRGNTYDSLGEHTKAFADLNKAISINPQYATAYNNRGYVYNSLGDYWEAIQDYTKAISINPQYALAYNNRGNAYNSLEDYDRALSDLNKAIDINPEYGDAYYNRGNVYKNSGDYSLAINDFTKAISINPKDVDAYNNRGNTFMFLDKYSLAVTDFNTAIDINPYNAVLYYNRGSTFLLLKDYTQAIADFSRAIDINQNDSYAFYMRGYAYGNIGDNKKAQIDFAKAKELGYVP